MAKPKTVSLKTRKAAKHADNTIDSSQSETTLDQGSHFVNGTRRSHRLHTISDSIINQEMPSLGQAPLGKTKPLPPAPAPNLATEIPDSAILSSSNNTALVEKTNSNEAVGTQSSEAKKQAKPKKRKQPEPSSDTTDLSAATPAKRRAGPSNRIVAPAAKKKCGVHTQGGVDISNDSRPDPVGKPPAWAEERQALCETFDCYRAYQSGPYHNDGIGYGYLVDKAAAGRIYMDGEVIITRAGGGCDVDTKGNRTQTKDHARSDPGVACFVNNIKKGIPVLMIVGSNNAHCPTRPLHRYSILGWFQCTDIWPETVNGKICFMLRFEKIDLWSVSWWDVETDNNLPRPDFTTKAFCQACIHCNTESKQVLEPGWVCLNEACTHYNLLDGLAISEDVERNPDFVNERTKFGDIEGLPDLIPALPDPESVDAAFTTERNSWKGIVCPKCQRCICRTYWDAWRCDTDDCHFVLPVKHYVHSAGSLIADCTSEYSGRALPLNKYLAPVVEHEPDFFGYWRIQQYTLFPGNTMTHFMANGYINRKPGGAHQILRELQEADLGLRRFQLSNCNVKGTLTGHFSANFGMPYKFVVPQDSQAFKDAPEVIMNGLSRMVWAGRMAVTDGSFIEFNELLALGYFEKQKIGYHDDGEDDLLGTIATMSIGGDAIMNLRMKEKWYFAKNLKSATYDPTEEVIPGMQGWEDRMKLNSLYGHISENHFNAAKKEFFKNVQAGEYGSNRTAPAVVSLKLKHGDITVMNGRSLQKYFEHAIIPEGKLRYAMTCRYVKPENIPKEDHWKAVYHIDAADMYDGDPNLIQEVKENMARLAAAAAANEA